jgi:hypothetical protein
LLSIKDFIVFLELLHALIKEFEAAIAQDSDYKDLTNKVIDLREPARLRFNEKLA